MNKEEALTRLTKLENEAKELRKILEETPPACAEVPAAPRSLLTRPEPGSGVHYYRTIGEWDTPSTHIACNVDRKEYKGGNYFQSLELAKKYRDAIRTLLLLRHQPGTTHLQDTTLDKRFIDFLGTCNLRVSPGGPFEYRIMGLSPAFISEHWALRAIENVGKDRILDMAKTLSHYLY